jgi:single-strand DNA-binding protein
METLIIAGTVGKDAVLRRTGNNDAVLGFSVAVDQGKDKNGNKRDTRWYDASIWGKRAESLQSYITKGTKLTLQGRPTAREHEGKVYMGIVVNELSFQGGASQRDTSQQDRGGRYTKQPLGADYQGDLDDEIPLSVSKIRDMMFGQK